MSNDTNATQQKANKWKVTQNDIDSLDQSDEEIKNAGPYIKMDKNETRLMGFEITPKGHLDEATKSPRVVKKLLKDDKGVEKEATTVEYDVYDFTTDEMKIFSVGKSWAKMIDTIIKQGGTKLLKITRTELGLGTKYIIIPTTMDE